MRQDVTGFFTMLQGDRVRGGMGIRAPGAGWGFGPGAGCEGIRARARDGGIRAPGAGWAGIRARARGGVGIRAPGAGFGGDSSRGAGWGFGPGRGMGGFGLRARGVDSGPGREVGWGFGPRARSGDFFGKMGNFLPFCLFFAVWVEICISSRLCMILYFQKLIVLYSND